MLVSPSYIISLSLVFQAFNILQQCSRILCFTIDNHLTLAVNDCYTRISIGFKLPDADIALRTDVTSLSECEENCLKNINGCNAFSLGVGAKGNSTCLISLRIPLIENLQAHPEYDVYARKRNNSLWCNFDRRYGSYTRKIETENRSVKIKKVNKKGSTINIGNPFSKLIPESISLGRLLFSRNKSGTENYGHTSIYDLYVNHDKYNRRVLDTVANQNEETSANSFVVTCHRKLQSDKKTMGLFIERIVNCDNLQDCCGTCDYENTFVCKGFNYRRRTDDSKCVRELTSIPCIRTNVDEDFIVDSHYDYYEKIENCPSSTRRGNGIQYCKLPVKDYKENSQNTWLDREGFTSPYDTLNWNHNWKSSESRHSDVINGNTLPSSRINSDTGYLNVKSSIFPKTRSRLGDRSLVHGFSISNENEHFYGKFYNYGTAFGYDDNHVPVSKESRYGKHETLKMINRCSVKTVSGSKLSRRVVKKTCLAHDLERCEDLCINETSFFCKSFAYRYNVLTTNPTDNCLLSDHSYQDLNFYTDLEPNRDYDSYTLKPDAKICYLKKSTNRYPSEECFSRIRSGFAMPIDITKKSVFVHDLGECQLACTVSQQFICKSFVFKYPINNPERHTHEHVSSNCFLTDWPSEEINPIYMPDMDGAELYERNTFSYGCDTYPYSFPSSTPNDNGFSSMHMDEHCYSEYHKPCKLMSHAIVSSTQAVTKSDCRRKCSTMRNAATIPCMSFNYNVNSGNTQNNCFLSDISVRDLRPNLDYVHDNDHTLYTWKDFDPYCRLTHNTFNTINATPDKIIEKYGQILSSMLSYPNTPTPLDGETPIHGPIYDTSTRWRNKFRSEDYRYNHNHNHNYNHDHDYVYKYEETNKDGKHPLDLMNFQYGLDSFHSNQISPSRRYTVNGYPCQNGTVCQRNEITGFWSCEIENKYGSWDYCCEPSHQCGFSQGYHHPWCYVGSNEDQWRPCSETYYPYYFSKDRSTYRQSPLYTARHWPVIYFHETSPTNCSINDSNT